MRKWQNSLPHWEITHAHKTLSIFCSRLSICRKTTKIFNLHIHNFCKNFISINRLYVCSKCRILQNFWGKSTIFLHPAWCKQINTHWTLTCKSIEYQVVQMHRTSISHANPLNIESKTVKVTTSLSFKTNFSSCTFRLPPVSCTEKEAHWTYLKNILLQTKKIESWWKQARNQDLIHTSMWYYSETIDNFFINVTQTKNM